MYKAHIVLEGITPILLNPATPELLADLEGQVKRGKVKLSNEEKVAKIAAYYEDNFGRLGLTRNYIDGNVVNAGRKVKADARSNITASTKSTMLWALMELHAGSFLPFVPEIPTTALQVDVQKGVNPNGGEAVVIARGRVDTWAIEFDVTVTDDALLPVSKLGDLLDIGGTAFGLGDFRPQKGGSFGQYAATITVTEKSKGHVSRVKIIDDIPDAKATPVVTQAEELVGAGVGSNGSDPS